MPQRLKDEVRMRILHAATHELLAHGESAGMRQIARAAGLTPGNLYRYYASKEELVAAITAPVVEGLAGIVRTASGEVIALGQAELPPLPKGEDCVELVEGEFRALMREILVQLAALCRQYPEPAAILLHTASAGETLIGWFRQLVEQAVVRMLRPQGCTAGQIKALADAECQAFCAGVAVLLDECARQSPADAAWLIDGYLGLHVGGMAALLRHGFASGAIRPEEGEQNA